MDKGFWIAAIGAGVTGLLFRGISYARGRETNSSGRPILKYLYSPLIIAGCSIFFTTVGVRQWLDPFNHRHSGNLLLLSYIPLVVGVFTLAFSVYCLLYRATLLQDSVHVRRWLLRDIHFPIDSIKSIEQKENRFVVNVHPQNKYSFYKMLSGHQYFLSELQESTRSRAK